MVLGGKCFYTLSTHLIKDAHFSFACVSKFYLLFPKRSASQKLIALPFYYISSKLFSQTFPLWLFLLGFVSLTWGRKRELQLRKYIHQIDPLCWLMVAVGGPRSTVSGSTFSLQQVLLGSIRRQAEQSWEARHYSTISPWFPLQFLTPGIFTAWVPTSGSPDNGP